MLLRTIIALSLSSICLTTTAAEEQVTNYYWGASVGIVDIDYSTKDPIAASFNLGYNFSDKWALEGQYTKSIVDGEIDSDKVNVINGNYDYDLESVGAYGVFRTGGNIYFKAKAGVMHFNVKDHSNTQSSAGIGLGFRITENKNTNLEIETTAIDNQSLYHSIKFNFGF